jgi:hypothetical protein
VKRHLLWLAAITLSCALAAAPAKVGAEVAPELEASVGFAGYANPLAEYPALFFLAGEHDTDVASTIYHDISPTPVHVRVGGPVAAGREIVVRTEASTVGLPTANALFVERGAYNPLTSGPGAPPPLALRYQVPEGAEEFEVYLPVCLYPPSPGVEHAVLQVELWEGGSLRATQSVEAQFLPARSIYSLLLEPTGGGLLEGDQISLAESPEFQGNTAPEAFVLDSRVLMASAADVGPDYRVLRHFQYVLVAGSNWAQLDGRLKELLANAAAMGTRLIVFNDEATLELRGQAFAPGKDVALARFGFGEVCVTTAGLAEVKRFIRAGVLERLARTYAFSRNELAPAAEVGWPLYRSRQMSTVEQFVPKYDWIGETGEGTVRLANPVWVYDYLTRPELGEPMSLLGFHWMSPARSDARKELAEWNPQQSWKYGWFLSYNLSSAVTGSIGRSLGWFTVVITSLALVSLWPRRRLAWFTAVFALVVVAATVRVLAGLGGALPSHTKMAVVSNLRSSALSDQSERRSVAYIYSSLSRTVELELDNETAMLTGLAPCEAADGRTLVNEGAGWAASTRVDALFPQEASFSVLEPAAEPLKAELTPAGDGFELRLKGDGSGLKLAFIADGPMCAYLGDLGEGDSITVDLPDIPPQTVGFTDYYVRLANEAIQSYTSEHIRDAYAGREEAVETASMIMLAQSMRQVLRNLVAGGEGITIVGLREGELELTLSGQRRTVPHYEIVVHRLR